MKSEKLLNAIGSIQDELISNAMPGKVEGKPRRFRKGIAIALAAALILTLTVGAGAASGAFRSLEDLFAPAFHNDGSAPALDMEVVKKLGRPVGVSATDNGVTVTVESVIRDRYTCTVVTSVKMDGLDGNEVAYNWCKGGGVLADLGSAASSTTDLTPGDDTMQIIYYWRSDSPILAGKAAVTIDDIVLNLHRPLREKTIEGTWELEFDMGYEDVSLELPAGQTVNVEGAEIVLDEIFLSPLSMRVDYTADLDGVDLEKTVRTDLYEMSLGQRLASLNIIITQKDGTQFFHLDKDFEGGGHIQNGSGNVEKREGEWKGFNHLQFSQMLYLDEIESITIEGVEIPLS